MTHKKDKFIQLAEKRLEKAIHSIEVLKPLADKSRYEYSEKQAVYIIKELRNAVNEVDKSFKGEHASGKKISIPRD